MYSLKLNGQLLWDPRVAELEIEDPKVGLEVNKAGSLTFRIFPAHPQYAAIQKLKSVIEAYQDDKLIFRGRPLEDELDTWNVKDIVCEGDLAMLNDSRVRPYEFQGTITEYLTKLLTDHNNQVEAGKEFTLGTVTVTDPNNLITRASSDYPTTWKEIENKLIDLLGGYILVRREGTTNYIDYLEDSTYISGQQIKLTENLLKVNQARDGGSIATAIIPIGAELTNEDGTKYRLNITSVNGGVDYVFNQGAVDTYGWIFAPAKFDDVTDAANLLTKANQALAQSITLLNSIELTAVDLSLIDVNIDEFNLFEYVEVISEAHFLNDLYLIRKMEIELMNPENNTITVGAEFTSMTEKQFQSDKALEIIANNIQAAVAEYTADELSTYTTELMNTIQQSSNQTLLTIMERHYLKNETDQIISAISTSLTQTKDTFNFQFDEVYRALSGVDANSQEEFEIIKRYIRFESGNIILGESGNLITLKLINDRIAFLSSGVEVAYFANNKMYVLDGHFINSLRVGNFAYTPRTNGNLSFGKVT